MDIDVDYQDLWINEPLYYNYTSELTIKNLLGDKLYVSAVASDSNYSHYGCQFKMESGILFGIQSSVKTNDIMNNRISLKYYV